MFFRSKRYLDREHTPLTWDVADSDITVLCSNRLARDRKSESQSCPIFPRRSPNGLNGSLFVSGIVADVPIAVEEKGEGVDSSLRVSES